MLGSELIYGRKMLLGVEVLTHLPEYLDNSYIGQYREAKVINIRIDLYFKLSNC